MGRFVDGRFTRHGLPDAGPEAEDGVQPDAFEGLTKDELLAEAERRGLDVPSGATKAVILEALRAAG